MQFHDQLSVYIEQIGCSGRELAEASGLSTATISRYRSGARTPENPTERKKLADGLALLAKARGVSALNADTISAGLACFFAESTWNRAHLSANLSTLLSTLSISVSDLARGISYDASYLSRIRSGQRQPANPAQFTSAVSVFICKRCDSERERRILSALLNIAPAQWDDATAPQRLAAWLGGRHAPIADDMSAFLQQLDTFDLNEYVRAIHFDELKVPTAPFHLPFSRTYFGIQKMRAGELDFLKATLLGKSTEPIFMCSDMPMDDMATDMNFSKKYMLGLALSLKKGLDLHVVHHLDRPFHELMLGLAAWMPLYMTGQITPYYLKGAGSNVYCHFLNVSGSAALSGESIVGAHAQGRYVLSRDRESLHYYRARAEAILKKALPLMEIYRENRADAFRAFSRANAQLPGKRLRMLSAPPLAVIEPTRLRKILCRCGLSNALSAQILNDAAEQKSQLDAVLAHSAVIDRVPDLSREEFAQYPLFLLLPGLFLEQDIRYTYEEYRAHLEDTQRYAQSHPNYTLLPSDAVFRNIDITVLPDQWALVSKGKSPSIHFLVRYPKLRDAIESFVSAPQKF